MLPAGRARRWFQAQRGEQLAGWYAWRDDWPPDSGNSHLDEHDRFGPVYGVHGEAELFTRVSEELSDGPKEVSVLSSQFSVAFNQKIRMSSHTPVSAHGRNDGSFKKWLIQCGFVIGPLYGSPIKNRADVSLPTSEVGQTFGIDCGDAKVIASSWNKLERRWRQPVAQDTPEDDVDTEVPSDTGDRSFGALASHTAESDTIVASTEESSESANSGAEEEEVDQRGTSQCKSEFDWRQQLGIGAAASSSSSGTSPSQNTADAGRVLLSMLQGNGAVCTKPFSEPMPLSTDEFQLWTMQAREDAEMGADKLNAETFGDDAGTGWSFEENLAAVEEFKSFRDVDQAQRVTPPQAPPRLELGASEQWLSAGAAQQRDDTQHLQEQQHTHELPPMMWRPTSVDFAAARSKMNAHSESAAQEAGRGEHQVHQAAPRHSEQPAHHPDAKDTAANNEELHWRVQDVMRRHTGGAQLLKRLETQLVNVDDHSNDKKTCLDKVAALEDRRLIPSLSNVHIQRLIEKGDLRDFRELLSRTLRQALIHLNERQTHLTTVLYQARDLLQRLAAEEEMKEKQVEEESDYRRQQQRAAEQSAAGPAAVPRQLQHCVQAELEPARRVDLYPGLAVPRLRTAIQEIAECVDIKPPMLKKTVCQVVKSGWKNITWRRSYTALHLAADHGRADVIPLLVALGADPLCKDVKGRTAIDIGRTNQDGAVVCALEKILANDVAEAWTAPPGSERWMPSWLLQSYTEDKLAPEKRLMGRAPLGRAPRCPDAAIQASRLYVFIMHQFVKLLDLQPECEIAIMSVAIYGDGSLTSNGSFTTALHVATVSARDDIIPLMVKLGADPRARNGEGMTAMDIAAAKNRMGIDNFAVLYSKSSWSCSSDRREGQIFRSSRESSHFEAQLRWASFSVPSCRASSRARSTRCTRDSHSESPHWETPPSGIQDLEDRVRLQSFKPVGQFALETKLLSYEGCMPGPFCPQIVETTWIFPCNIMLPFVGPTEFFNGRQFNCALVCLNCVMFRFAVRH